MTPSPVTLFTSEPSLPPGGFEAGAWWAVVLWVLAGLAVVGVSAAVSVLAWRGRWRDPPCTRAAAVLCRSLGVRPEGSALLRRLSSALGAEPVALLLSETAFERGIRAFEEAEGPMGQHDKAIVLALRATVFGGGGDGWSSRGEETSRVTLGMS